MQPLFIQYEFSKYSSSKALRIKIDTEEKVTTEYWASLNPVSPIHSLKS